MQKHHDTAQDLQGNIINTATITVFDANTGTPSSIFEDDETTPLNNPFTGSDLNYDFEGSFWFKAANGTYDIKIVGATTKWKYDVQLFDGAKATPLSLGYIYGLMLSNDTDASHDINIAAGECAAKTGELLNLSSEITKKIDASWALGDNAGGLSSSLTVANNTSYHYFLVKIAGSVDVIIDTSPVCANGIADHSVTKYRRLGAEKTDGSANIIPTLRRGINVMFDVPIVEQNGAYSTTGASLTISTPSGIRTEAIIYHWQTSQSGSNIYARLSNIESTNLAVAFGNATNVSGDSGSFVNGNFVRVITDLGGNIRERASTTNSGVITLHGYNDISILEGL